MGEFCAPGLNKMSCLRCIEKDTPGRDQIVSIHFFKMLDYPYKKEQHQPLAANGFSCRKHDKLPRHLGEVKGKKGSRRDLKKMGFLCSIIELTLALRTV
jgi:hypothetical protein